MTPIGSAVETLRTVNLGFFKNELARGATEQHSSESRGGAGGPRRRGRAEEARERPQPTAVYGLHSTPDSTQLLAKQGASIPETAGGSQHSPDGC